MLSYAFVHLFVTQKKLAGAELQYSFQYIWFSWRLFVCFSETASSSKNRFSFAFFQNVFKECTNAFLFMLAVFVASDHHMKE